MCKSCHILWKNIVKSSYLDNIFLERLPKHSRILNIYILYSVICTRIWLIPLVDDHESTYITKLTKKTTPPQYSICGRKFKMACYFGHAKVLKANSNSWVEKDDSISFYFGHDKVLEADLNSCMSYVDQGVEYSFFNSSMCQKKIFSMWGYVGHAKLLKIDSKIRICAKRRFWTLLCLPWAKIFEAQLKFHV